MRGPIKVSLSTNRVTIANLTIKGPDLSSLLAAQPESNWERCVLDIIAVGTAAMLRVQTTVDVDFIEKRFEMLKSQFEGALNTFEKLIASSLSKRFSPTESGSYTKHIGELVGGA